MRILTSPLTSSLSGNIPPWISIPPIHFSRYLPSWVLSWFSFHYHGTSRHGTRAHVCISRGQHWLVYYNSWTPSYGGITRWISPPFSVIYVRCLLFACNALIQLLAASKLYIGASVGIPAAGLCISHRLYKIAVIKSVSVTREDVSQVSSRVIFLIDVQKRRAVIIDLCIAIGIPVIIMTLRKHSSTFCRSWHLSSYADYVVQGAWWLVDILFNMLSVYAGHRFDILEDVGCNPSIYNTLPAYFLVFMWPTVLGCASFVFSCKFISLFWIHLFTLCRKRWRYAHSTNGAWSSVRS